MKQNRFLFMFIGILILGVFFAAHLYFKYGLLEIAKFIVDALTAIGTCGVVILSLFPYKHQDKLSAILYRRLSDGQIMLKVINKTDHSVRLGASNLPFLHYDNFMLWWRPEEEQSLENAIPIWRGGVGLVIPPHDCVFFCLYPEEFEGVSIKDVRMQIRTNTGYKCDVINEC